jgi:hypothetical protein
MHIVHGIVRYDRRKIGQSSEIFKKSGRTYCKWRKFERQKETGEGRTHSSDDGFTLLRIGFQELDPETGERSGGTDISAQGSGMGRSTKSPKVVHFGERKKS